MPKGVSQYQPLLDDEYFLSPINGAIVQVTIRYRLVPLNQQQY